MAFYIKVRKEVADYLQLTTERNRTADGCVLLWQADVTRFPGDTVLEKAAYVGGVALQPAQAKQETDGTDYPVQVRLPEWLEPEEIPAEEITEIPAEEAEESSEAAEESSEESTEEPSGEAEAIPAEEVTDVTDKEEQV